MKKILLPAAFCLLVFFFLFSPNVQAKQCGQFPDQPIVKDMESIFQAENGRQFAIGDWRPAETAESAKQKRQGPSGPLHARAALLMDADNCRVLWEKEGYTQMPMASTTKIMTCILALEKGDPKDLVEVSGKASAQPKVKLGMSKGEQYRLEDLLYSLMLESHNDTAMAIAEHIGGSQEGFAKLMNEKAKELGCENTCFITPNGLDATVDGKQHSTTARDLAVIAAYAIRNETFCSIIGTAAYRFSDASGKRSFTVYNKDRFLTMMEGAIGIKTGFTGGAGYCFVGALERDGRKYVSVVLGSGWPPNRTWKWTDTQALMAYGLEQYSKQDIFEAQELPRIPVIQGRQETVSLQSAAKKMELLWSDQDSCRVEVKLPESLAAPVEAGKRVGEVRYYVNDALYDKIPILTAEEVLEYTYPYCLKLVWDSFLP